MTGTRRGTPNTVRPGAPLAAWTTFGLGGPARSLVEVEDVGSLSAVLDEAEAAASPVLVLGGGSNLVISDDGFSGTVVRVGIKGVHIETDLSARAGGADVLVRAGAGEDWSSLVSRCVAEGLSGTECLSGIPGLVGGAPVQNVGAYGQEVAATIVVVRVWDRHRHCARDLVPGECGFVYRDSVFKRRDRYVVTGVSLRLQRSVLSQPLRYPELARHLGRELGQQAPLELTARAVVDLRRSKGMVLDATDPDTRSAGSFFTNPVLDDFHLARVLELAPDIPRFPGPLGTKVPAAWLVEKAGFAKGYRLAGAAISSKHALALTAREGGTTADLLALARVVRDGVEDRFGVRLEPEPVLVGVHL
jgi:UDP-N-acetylmuramate dehydrogenase